MNVQPILIIGRNSKTGSRVNQRLKEIGLPTRAVSRTTTPVFDWENKATWLSAMAGTSKAYVSFQPDLAIPTAEQTIKDFIQLAIELGLKHIVLLSGRGEDGAQRAEQVLKESGITWNVIRSSWFAQNFSEAFMTEGILTGELFLPADGVKEPFIDIDDIADVAVAALTQKDLHNHLFEVTGPRSITFQQCVDEISSAIGYPVKYTTIPVNAFIGPLKEQGHPEGIQWLMRELFTVVLDGRNSQVMDGIEQALGRPATDFSHYIRKVLATRIWVRNIDKQTD